ncbi:MAG TPA: hypothetical protein VMW06_08655 [Desulfobacterales bacterium]|nr:hypothetical protein [Desulfobacterales bacterium]
MKCSLDAVLNCNSERILKWKKFLTVAAKHCRKAEHSLQLAAGSFKSAARFTSATEVRPVGIY